MPVVNFEQYKQMLKNASENHYAYPAFNISNMETVNAVLKGLAAAKSDGIIQVSTGGGAHASGTDVNDSVVGAIALANHIHLMAQYYDIYVAIHTDHCKQSKIDSFLIPLIEETERRRARGESNLFSSHMFDGSDVPLSKNIEISQMLLERCAKNDIILEVESGVVGGEEDGEDNSGVPHDELYTTSEDMLKLYGALHGKGEFIFAATFGNVHGVYQPGNVKLNPKVLRDGQAALKKEYGEDAKFLYVFHGGSGSGKDEIEETLHYGVIKMNVDTDTQYAFTRPIAAHMFENYDGVLKVDGDVGDKKVYDPRSYMKKAEKNMALRVVEACNDLHSAGKTMFHKA